MIRAAAVRLLTSDYVIDETLTLLRYRGAFERAIAFGMAVFQGVLADVYWVDQSDILNAWRMFQEYRDKAWSFTDCVSFVVIERLEIRQAIAFDRHFSQFGGVEVLA